MVPLESVKVVGTGRFSSGCLPGAGGVLRQSCCASNSGCIGIDDLDAGVGVLGATGDILGDFLAGHGNDDDPLIVGEGLLADLLY